ncbi:MAG TPA: SgcJ/EcaC family oxidoreductase [Candidatus Binatia bacterium]|nr:SgcJ/EcaC family oxidoreductase [Candidatus Binatia bacterium]
MPPKTPEDCDRLFGEFLNSGQLDRLVALYETDGVLVNQDRSTANGTNAIRAALGEFLAMKPAITMNVVQVVKAGNDLAVLYNDWSATAATPDGTTLDMAGKAMEIVRRQTDGTWRFVIDDPFARG